MNLHSIASGIIGAVNPQRPLSIRVSTGNTEDDTGRAVPTYATPGAFVGSIVGNVLTVVSQSEGKLLVGQQLAATDILPDTTILDYLTGSGGIGTYRVSNSQNLTERPFTTQLVVPGQVQPIAWRDIQMMEGLNLQGTRKKIWLYRRFDGLIRPTNKGGDLITDLTNNDIYLVAQVDDQWDPNVWCSVFATLQNNS